MYKDALHLQLSLSHCLFVCLDESCDLAEGTLCSPSNWGMRKKRGGERKKVVSLQCSNEFNEDRLRGCFIFCE